jgi:hypothetical protein
MILTCVIAEHDVVLLKCSIRIEKETSTLVIIIGSEQERVLLFLGSVIQNLIFESILVVKIRIQKGLR